MCTLDNVTIDRSVAFEHIICKHFAGNRTNKQTTQLRANTVRCKSFVRWRTHSMSCKSALSNSIKSNSEQQQQQWPKAQTSVETNVKLAGDEAKDRLYEPKHKKKVVRVLTVVAYVFSVSLAAIMLSLYYIFIWNPQSRAAGARHASEGEAKPRYNCPEMMNEEALAQIKADVSSLGTTAPVDGSWQTTTAGDSAESVYDEASSSETKIDESNLLLSNLDGTMLNSYESGDVINNTAYK